MLPILRTARTAYLEKSRDAFDPGVVCAVRQAARPGCYGIPRTVGGVAMLLRSLDVAPTLAELAELVKMVEVASLDDVVGRMLAERRRLAAETRDRIAQQVAGPAADAPQLVERPLGEHHAHDLPPPHSPADRAAPVGAHAPPARASCRASTRAYAPVVLAAA